MIFCFRIFVFFFLLLFVIILVTGWPGGRGEGKSGWMRRSLAGIGTSLADVEVNEPR